MEKSTQFFMVPKIPIGPHTHLTSHILWLSFSYANGRFALVNFLGKIPSQLFIMFLLLLLLLFFLSSSYVGPFLFCSALRVGNVEHSKKNGERKEEKHDEKKWTTKINGDTILLMYPIRFCCVYFERQEYRSHLSLSHFRFIFHNANVLTTKILLEKKN